LRHVEKIVENNGD